MATTATNKQPLLVDRPFHFAVAADSLTSGSGTTLNITGTNESRVLVDCSSNDGGVIEDLYVIARGDVAYTAVFYLSRSTDYLRPNEATYIQKITSDTTIGFITSAELLPKVLAPTPGTGSAKPTACILCAQRLWCCGAPFCLQDLLTATETPIIAAQGGFY